MSEKILKCKKTEFVPPEGGWGYMICVAVIIIYTVTMGFSACFGLMYNDFIVEVNMGTGILALINGINFMGLAVSGVITSLLLKLVSVRQLGLLATALFCGGFFLQIFIHSIIMFFICQSVLQSFGFGILYNLTCRIVNEYFVKRRLLAVGIIQSTIGLIALWIPMLIKALLEAFGYQGMLLIVTGITLNIIPAVILMQPVKNHMKKVEILEDNNVEMEVLLLEKTEKSDDVPIVKIIENEKIPPIDSEDVENNDDAIKTTKKTKGSPLMETFKEIFDKDLLKGFLPTYACLGLGTAVFADIIYGMMIPQILYTDGWNQKNVAFALSCLGFGDLAARFILIFFNKWLSVFKSVDLHLVGPVVAVITRIGVIYCEDLTYRLIFLTISGVPRCFIGTLIPLVIAEETESEKFTAAMGLFLLSTGFINLGLGYIVGVVRDLTGRYDSVLWMSTACLTAIIIQWCIESLYKKCKQKKKYEKCHQKSLN